MILIGKEDVKWQAATSGYNLLGNGKYGFIREHWHGGLSVFFALFLTSLWRWLAIPMASSDCIITSQLQF